MRERVDFFDRTLRKKELLNFRSTQKTKDTLYQRFLKGIECVRDKENLFLI
jgi:hypothetical protein